jgi:diguanylate cyclase (GGDEF)-like protein
VPVNQLLAPLLERLRALPKAWAVAMIGLFSIIASIVLTGIMITIFVPGTPLNEWLWIAIAAPAIIAPMVGYVVMSLVHELDAVRAVLARAAALDPLTGVGNRRQFIERAGREAARTRREHGMFGLLMLDIDHFKQVNDVHGHAVGDMVLIEVAAACVAQIRESDSVFRWGGEEFVVLLPRTDEASAVVVAEKLRTAVGALAVEPLGRPITLSIGVAAGDGHARPEDIVAKADGALYRAKQAGRDRVMQAGTAAG